MKLPFATQQPAIFLNHTIVTACLKPANGFSLHRDKIQLLCHHLLSKAWMIWSQEPFSICTLIYYTPDLSFLAHWPQGLFTILFCSNTLFPDLRMMAGFLSFRSQFKWQCYTKVCPDYHSQSRSLHSLFWHGLIFSSSKTLSVSKISLFVHMLYHLSWHNKI